MPNWLKWTLISLGTFVLCIGLLTAGFLFWLSRDYENVEKQLIEREAAGEKFGQGKSSDACISRALEETRECWAITCELKARHFLAACLRESKPKSDLCDIPNRNDILQSSNWAVNFCKQAGGDSWSCPRLVGEIQKFCQES